MAFQIPLKLKTTFSPQGVPAASEMSFGELVVNASTGIVWTKKLDGNVVAITGDGGGPIGPITLEDITDVNNFWQNLILTSSTANEVKSKLNFGGPYAAQSHTHHISSIAGLGSVGLALAGTSTEGEARQALNLGSISVQNSNSVIITGGAITGMPVPVNPSGVANKDYTDTRDAVHKTKFAVGTVSKTITVGSSDVVLDFTDLDINTVENLIVDYTPNGNEVDGRYLKIYMSVDKNSIDPMAGNYSLLLDKTIAIQLPSNKFIDGLIDIPPVLTPHYNIAMTFVYSGAAGKFKLYECTYTPVAWMIAPPDLQ